MMEKIKELIKKIRGIKNIEIIIGLVIIAIVIIIYSTVSTLKADKQADTAGDITTELEARLEAILSEIECAGKVDVMITYATTENKITATSTNTHSTTTVSGNSETTTVTTTTSPVMQGSSAVVLGEQMPEIIGVLVVAEGAKDIKVQLKLRDAVSTVLGINPNTIQILTRRAV